MPYGLQLAQAAGAQATGNAVNEGFGLLLAKQKRDGEQKSARNMQNIALEGEAIRMSRNEEMAMRMFENTGYGAQVAQMKKAGLNPGLLYGMSAGGGTTTATAPGASTASGTSPQASRGSEGMGIMIGQMGLLQAQEENIRANTEKTKAEANKLSGVDTRLGEQNIKTGEAQETLTRIDTELRRVQASVARQTINDAMQTIENAAKKGTEEIQLLKLTQEEKTQEINKLKAEIGSIAIKNALMNAQKNNTNQDTKNKIQEILESEQRIKTMSGHLAIAWDQLSLNTTQTRINWDNFLDKDEGWQYIKDMIPNLLIPIGRGFGGATHTPIQGFQKR